MKRRRTLPASPYDLFGEIPVTQTDIDAWCLAVAGLPTNSWRRPYYIAHWNVVGKIQSAKASGTFETIVNGP